MARSCPLQAEVFPDRDHFGRIFYNQARMSAAGIPQIALVMGRRRPGGAYVPAMSDETVIVNGHRDDLPRRPAAGEGRDRRGRHAEELGGSELHTRRSGVADHEALDDEHALALGRSIVSNLNRKAPDPPWDRREPCEPAVRPPRRCQRLAVCGRLARPAPPVPVRELIARLVDGRASTSSSRSTARRS